MASGGVREPKKLKLYSSFPSSCSSRVRIALNWKEFLKLNPLGYVPVLVDEDIVISDSFAILMAANIVSSSIQPFQNLAVRKYIGEKIGPDEQLVWVKYHIGKGFAALEKLLKDYAGKYATGDEVYLADLFLAPQIHDAIKVFGVDINEYPLLSGLNEAYNELPAFQDAMTEKQPNTPVEASG